jgi:membrane glycosyltransferase
MKNNMIMPSKQICNMAIQDLAIKPLKRRSLKISPQLFVSRLFLVLGTLGITSWGSYEMAHLLNEVPNLFLRISGQLLFTLNFLWISFSAVSAILGFFSLGKKMEEEDIEGSKTAIVMPIYNEDVSHSFASLEVMARELISKKAGSCYELVILSDSNHPTAMSEEVQSFKSLKKHLGNSMKVWYRHREDNIERKPGNIGDFVRGWGERYDYMIVLDADSLMSSETLLALVRRMQGNNSLGILQTVPTLHGKMNLYARLQQFASQVYGRVNAQGIAAWAGNTGNFWGHNAIIRVNAFAESCGLPKLKGNQPFGGSILSHDIVEAALIRRNGWDVQIATDLDGSWEECPPTLIDSAIRDRRWVQGNFQHLKVLRTKGISFFSKIHFLIGIMGYLSSLLWLLQITGSALFLLPQFSFHLGIFEEESMVQLFFFTLVVLFLPKVLGLLHTLSQGIKRRKLGGTISILCGCILEILFSALMAPVQMLMTVKNIGEVIMGQDSGWKAQTRECLSCSRKEAWSNHGMHFFVGAVITVLLIFFESGLFWWGLPILLGLVFSVPLARLTSSVRVGEFFLTCHLFSIPEEILYIPLISKKESLQRKFRMRLCPESDSGEISMGWRHMA